MVSRVLRDLGADKQQIMVLNDEAHHCYMDKPLPAGEKADKEQQAANEEARVWFKGLQAIAKHVGIKQVFDLSATPFYLKGSGYNEGYIFPWTVSDFSLMDAIESGIVKVPRTPVDDDADHELVTYLRLWDFVGDAASQARREGQGQRTGSRHRSSKVRCGACTAATRRRSTHWESRARAVRRDAAGVHRRLPEHRRQQARLRLDRRRAGRGGRRGRRAQAGQPRRCSATSWTASRSRGRGRSSSTQRSWSPAKG